MTSAAILCSCKSSSSQPGVTAFCCLGYIDGVTGPCCLAHAGGIVDTCCLTPADGVVGTCCLALIDGVIGTCCWTPAVTYNAIHNYIYLFHVTWFSDKFKMMRDFACPSPSVTEILPLGSQRLQNTCPIGRSLDGLPRGILTGVYEYCCKHGRDVTVNDGSVAWRRKKNAWCDVQPLYDRLMQTGEQRDAYR